MPAKMVKRISSNTTERRGLPSSPELLSNFTNYRGNYEQQRAVRPTTWCGDGWTTPNGSGRADTRGVGTALETGRIEYPKNDSGATKV